MQRLRCDAFSIPPSSRGRVRTSRLPHAFTDPDGVQSVVLQYQLVNPGDYVAISDPRYATELDDDRDAR